MTDQETSAPGNGCDVEALASLAGRLAARLGELGYSAEGLVALLGADTVEALHRGEPEAVAWALDNPPTPGAFAGSPEALRFLIRALILREPVTPSNLAEMLGADLARDVRACGAVRDAPGQPGRVAATIDIRPVILHGHERLVFSDCDASITALSHEEEHVAGLGQASLTLSRSVPVSAVGSLLDLGSGCGAQALAQLGCAREIVATDVLGRAAAFTRATLAGAGADRAASPIPAPGSVAFEAPEGARPARVEVLTGSWFEPVAGRRFDRIVSNPPFVIGPPEVGHVYRDSGLGLDNASRLVANGAVDHLAPGGRAHLLASWAHIEGEAWQERVASWLPEAGVEAWVLQRDQVSPQAYVATWLQDEGVDPRTEAGRAQSRRWLDYLAEHRVQAIGFGFLAIENTGQAQSQVVAEELSGAFEDPLGPEVEDYFERVAWLRELGSRDVLDARFALRPGLAREDVAVADEDSGMGFHRAVLRLTRTEGPRFSHEVDEHVAALIAGLHPEGLSAGEVAELFAAARGVDPAEVREGLRGIVIDLVRHGLILPAELSPSRGRC